jgi:hypothetical protein
MNATVSLNKWSPYKLGEAPTCEAVYVESPFFVWHDEPLIHAFLDPGLGIV